MRALRSLLLLLLVLPAVQPAAYDGEEDSGQNAEFSVDRANEGGRPTTSRPNTSLKGDYDHEYSNERPGSSRSAEATTAAPSPAARTTPTSSASYEVNLDSSESSTQFPAWVGRSSEERRAKGGGGGSNKQATSTPSPSYDDTPASSPLPKVHSKQQQSLSFAPYDVPRGSAAAKEARARFSKRPPASARMNSIGQQHQRPASSHSQAAGYPQRAAVSSAAPSLRHAAGRTSALPSLRRQQPTAALPQPAAQHSQGRYQFAKMNGEPPPQTAGYAPARRQGPSAYSWAKMSPSTRQQPGGMRGGYQTKPPVAAPRPSPAAYRPTPPFHQQPRGYARPSGGSALPQRPQSYSLPRPQALQTNRPAANYAQHPQHSVRPQPSPGSQHPARPHPSAYQQRTQAAARPQARSFVQPRPQLLSSPASHRPTGYGRPPVNGEYSMAARPAHSNRRPPPQHRLQPARLSTPSAYNQRPPSTNYRPAGHSMGAGSSRVSHNRGQSARVAPPPAFRTRRPPTTPAPQSNGRPARPWTMKLSTATVASAENLGVNPSGYKYGS